MSDTTKLSTVVVRVSEMVSVVVLLLFREGGKGPPSFAYKGQRGGLETFNGARVDGPELLTQSLAPKTKVSTPRQRRQGIGATPSGSPKPGEVPAPEQFQSPITINSKLISATGQLAKCPDRTLTENLCQR